MKIGHQMADWEKHELIMRFRDEFKSCRVEFEGTGTNISGESTMRTSF